MDRKRFAMYFLRLTEATNKELSDPLVDVWYPRFGAFREEEFRLAIDMWLDTSKWFPTPKEFADVLESVLSPEEREIQDGIRSMRGWMSRGVVPIGIRDPGELAAVKAALGLPPPTPAELAKVAERGPGEDGLRPGPVVARLLGADRPALAGGR